ncbi:hypothetical protein [Bradyrhizobium sp. USDA 3256]
MRTATNVVQFPSKKPTFKAEKFDLDGVLEQYDSQREYLIVLLKALRDSPAGLAKKCAEVAADPNIAPGAVSRLISEGTQLAGYYADLAGTVQEAVSRLAAVNGTVN